MTLNIRVVKFWTKYVTRNGEAVGVDMVEYCAPGMAQRSTTVAPVSHLSRVREAIDPDDVAGDLARRRWGLIRPLYEAWKQNQEIPTNGTPLGAWSGITQEQADVLRQFGLRTVEDVAEATDSVVSRVPLPGVRNLQVIAKNFLGSRDQARVAEDMARKDGEIASLKADQEEMMRLLEDMQRQLSEQPKGKRKSAAAEAEAA